MSPSSCPPPPSPSAPSSSEPQTITEGEPSQTRPTEVEIYYSHESEKSFKHNCFVQSEGLLHGVRPAVPLPVPPVAGGAPSMGLRVRARPSVSSWTGLLLVSRRVKNKTLSPHERYFFAKIIHQGLTATLRLRRPASRRGCTVSDAGRVVLSVQRTINSRTL